MSAEQKKASYPPEKEQLIPKPKEELIPAKDEKKVVIPAEIPNDFIILVSFGSSGGENQDAKENLTQLVQVLDKLGFDTQARPASRTSLYVFAKLREQVLVEKIYESRLVDSLHGTGFMQGLATEEELEKLPVTTAEKTRVIYRLLVAPGEGGITPGYGNWTFVESIFLLHDRETESKWFHSWSRKLHISSADIETIRAAFGDVIAMHFSFLHFYSVALTIPAILGIIAYFFLPEFSLVFTIFSGLWSLIFIKLWEKKQESLAIKWGTKGSSQCEERLATFQPDRMTEDPVTGDIVGTYSTTKRLFKIGINAVPLAIIAALAVFAVQLIGFTLDVFLSQIYNGRFKSILTLLPTAILVGVTPVVTSIYTLIAAYLTSWENHETKEEYKSAIVRKTFALDILVSYSALLLTAFVYMPFAHLISPHIPQIHSKTVGLLRYDFPAFTEVQFDKTRLHNQYIYFITTAQIIALCLKTFLPPLIRFIIKQVQAYTPKDEPGITYAEQEKYFMSRVEYEAALPDYNIGLAYGGEVKQFGYLTLFAPIWPLGFLVSLIGNWFDLRADVANICRDFKRPIPERAESIGCYLGQLKFLTWLGSLVIPGLVCLFRSSNEPYFVITQHPWYFFGTIALSEHIYFILRAVIDALGNLFTLPETEHAERAFYRLRQRSLAARLSKRSNIRKSISEAGYTSPALDSILAQIPQSKNEKKRQ